MVQGGVHMRLDHGGDLRSEMTSEIKKRVKSVSERSHRAINPIARTEARAGRRALR